MNQAKTEAIAAADAELNNTGLPTYTELLAALREVRESERAWKSVTSNVRLRGAAREKSVRKAGARSIDAVKSADAMLARAGGAA